MRIAVFTNQFPGHVNTFFARDVRSLIDAGWGVDIFPIYPLDERLFRYVPAVLGPDVLDRQRLHHVSPWSGMAHWRQGSGVRLRDGLKQFSRITASSVRFGPSPAL